MNKIDLIDRDSGLKYDIGNVEDFSLRVLDSLGIINWELSVMFSDDVYIAELNKKYRHKDGATDVLTFCETDSGKDWLPVSDDGGSYYAGDIIISVETLAANAEYFKVQEAEELKRLIVHGILHLKGMDHETNNAEEEMLKLQEIILKEFGEYKF